ncbi:MAG: transcriptional repressor LexA [Fimbriimonadales bacterium]|jgi:repressor LexA|nr:transcriptional repressor LexA [Armatimonadota bacterium]MCX7688613.1 transcriptional repressor LexA [Fimbriimonadales bacterium]CUU02530.1 repressor LexA [Armatimonadetes bacterium GBS]CUU36733.1 repressor LexA [Armatimonadetes bacterium DC]CUU37440.1 repressor LexA [Armatimonadetes bacterium GXS]GBC89626.1 LexA repressor [bacterium HR14]
MAKGLTKAQKAILQFIVEYTREHGYPPTLREIQQHSGTVKSLRGVAIHLDALQRKGYIERGSQARSIRILHPDYQPDSERVRLLPLVGDIAAGTPILAQENIEDLIPVPADMVRNVENAFLLRVKGDSMTGEHILPRDLVVIKPQETAYNGELVAVLVNDEATIKRIYFEKDRVRLQPANPAYEPIYVRPEEARVIGKVIGLIRDYGQMGV